MIGRDIRDKLKERRENEMAENLAKTIAQLEEEGYEVQFGEIGRKTTYAIISRGDEEIVGYTFVKDVAYKNEIVGKYKAIQQVLVRKSFLESEAAEVAN